MFATARKVKDIRPMLGCDPEFFFKQDGVIIGAETILPKAGLKAGTGGSKFVIDGVQAELNPQPSYCRSLLGSQLKACFVTLRDELKKQGKNTTVDFNRAVEISKDELDKLSEDSKKFGCAPSKSIYTRTPSLKLRSIDPAEYRVRAAGGHIHIGATGDGGYTYPGLKKAVTTDHKRTVKMLDILCGNTAVLMDRDKANIERRKFYGKAGEYRLPEHGLEYRTLSNFWLTSYPLMSFAFGMARLAIQLMADDRKDEFYNEFTSKIKTRNVHRAINSNNFDLAMENFKAIESLLLEVSHENSTHAISKANINEFYYFIDVVQNKGLEHWFSEDPMTHWTGTVGSVGGFHDFLLQNVKADMKKNGVTKTAEPKKAVA